MTSTPVTILSFRSSLDFDRPFPSQTQQGQLSVCLGAAEPGLYVEDINNNVVKIGPAHYGTTAPNEVYVGESGNFIGEQWFDSNSSPVLLRVWDGFDWASIGAGSSAFANTATLASGAILASGAVTSLFANTATLSSGSVLASGAVTSLFANTATLASGAILASGAVTSLFANTATLSSGSVLASGAVLADSVVSAVVVIPSGLPNPAITPSGSSYLALTESGTYPSGLYIRAGEGWYWV